MEKLCNTLNLILQGCICLMKSQFFPETQAGQKAIKLETKPHKDMSNRFTDHRVYRHSFHTLFIPKKGGGKAQGGCLPPSNNTAKYCCVIKLCMFIYTIMRMRSRNVTKCIKVSQQRASRTRKTKVNEIPREPVPEFSHVLCG